MPWKFYDMVNILNYFNSLAIQLCLQLEFLSFSKRYVLAVERGEQPLRRNKSKETIERLHLERHW